jgi:peptidoglycan/LPS O-acetylase OafA/YrhL
MEQRMSPPKPVHSFSIEPSYAQPTNHSKTNYVPALDALRFFAFLAVFCHHAIGAYPRNSLGGRVLAEVETAGAFGVCLFFVLSAYLITDLLLKEKVSAGRIDLKAFYMRRILRIWPLYFPFVIGLFILGRIAPHLHMRMSAAVLTTLLLFVSNFFIARNGFFLNSSNHLWSISLEEQFYALWPVVLSFFGGTAAKAFALACVPVALISIWFLRSTGADPSTAIWCATAVQFLFFGLGCYLGFSPLAKGKSVQRALLYCASGLVAWAAAAVLGVIGNASVSPVALCAGYTLVAAGAALLLVGALRMPDKWVPRQIAYLGKISYGLYMFHMPVISLVGRVEKSLPGLLQQKVSLVIACLAITILAAHLSYKYWESPFLRLKRRFEVIESRPV